MSRSENNSRGDRQCHRSENILYKIILNNVERDLLAE